jgi:protein-S-isoprenylcysteine O-methyltransferase Ste14
MSTDAAARPSSFDGGFAGDVVPARRTLDVQDIAARALLAGLFVALAIRIGADFLRTARITGLLLLVSESLVVVLTVIRRRAQEVDRSWPARAATMTSVAGPPLVEPAVAALAVSDAVTALISACGLLVIVAGKLSLGRSFGLLPANRGIVSAGMYGIVRHPIYAGYLVTHVGFLLGHWGVWNAVVLIGSDAALLVRAIYEERTLERDPAYAEYRARVRWRVAPGLF